MRIIKFTEYIKEKKESKDKNAAGGNGVAYVTLNQNGMGKIVAPIISEIPGSTWQDKSGRIGSGESVKTDLFSFSEYIKEEQDAGGGIAFATGNANGMGNVVAPTVGSTPGSVWGSGSGTIGSGDAPAYDYGNRFGLTINNKKDKKGKKRNKRKRKNTFPRYFTKEYMAL
jgi:hypothetical protein